MKLSSVISIVFDQKARIRNAHYVILRESVVKELARTLIWAKDDPTHGPMLFLGLEVVSVPDSADPPSPLVVGYPDWTAAFEEKMRPFDPIPSIEPLR